MTEGSVQEPEVAVGYSTDVAPAARWRIVLQLRTVSEAMKDLRDDVAAAAGLHTTDLEAVTHLSEGPMPMGVLGKRLALTPGAVTGLVDRLERVGHVHRATHPTDRRQTIVELNPSAQRMIEDYFSALAARLLALLEPYSDDQLAAIERFLTELPGALAPRDRAG